MAFSTFLESHIDIAFDFFELWSLRNIFMISQDLPIAVPYQRGLDLGKEPGEGEWVGGGVRGAEEEYQ